MLFSCYFATEYNTKLFPRISLRYDHNVRKYGRKRCSCIVPVEITFWACLFQHIFNWKAQSLIFIWVICRYINMMCQMILNISKLLRTPIFTEHIQWLLLTSSDHFWEINSELKSTLQETNIIRSAINLHNTSSLFSQHKSSIFERQIQKKKRPFYIKLNKSLFPLR